MSVNLHYIAFLSAFITVYLSLSVSLSISVSVSVCVQVVGTPGNQVIVTIDPELQALGLPQYPSLPASTEPTKLEEIRRTLLVSNLDPSACTPVPFSPPHPILFYTDS